MEKHFTFFGNSPIKIHVHKIENRVTFKITKGYCLELLTPEAIKLLGRTKDKIIKDKNGEEVRHLKISELVLVHCNVVNNDYQHDLRVLHTFVPNKLLLGISPKNFIYWRSFNSKLLCIEIWFTDQNFKPVEMEDKINISLVIK